jgi:hypothetical protein
VTSEYKLRYKYKMEPNVGASCSGLRRKIIPVIVWEEMWKTIRQATGKRAGN